jgi:hypothetical protein
MAQWPVWREDAGSDVIQVGSPRPDDATRRRRRVVAAVALGAVLLATAVVAALVRSAPHPAADPGRLGPAPSPGRTASSSAQAPAPLPVADLHANGALFGYGNGTVVHEPDLHVPALTPESSPTWSPSGSQIAVLDNGWIRVTRVATGASYRIACPTCREISWSPDGKMFAAAPVEDGSLGLVDAVTGELTTFPAPQTGAVLSLTWAPDSEQLAFLANAGQGHSGVFTIRADGTGLSEVLGLDAHYPKGGSGSTQVIVVRWSPAGQRLAVLTATPDPPSVPPPISEYRLRVVTMSPDGSALRSLVGDGRCACSGFSPDLAWSPDGTTLAVLAQHPRPGLVRPDGVGHRLRIRFVVARQGVALTWQPLPG